MFLNAKHIMNEGYEKKGHFFNSGKGSNIFLNKRKMLDLSLCAGSLILGHNSEVFKNAMKNVLNNNISNFAAKNTFAVDFSKTLKRVYPKYSDFIFCNSGTEAVFKSLRVARAISNKNLIISVTGSWHGSTGELLFTSDKNLKNIELSDGLGKQSKKNIKFIPYNNIEISKKILNKHKNKIMCIIIEPIQGCLPINAKEYLKFLSDYAKKNKIILIFDEMITGLRFKGSSVQDILKLNPSISTFGKCFGGGLPIGIIALKKEIVKKLKKQKRTIFFGGTFSGNSINTYVGNKITNYILKNKKSIFNDLEAKSGYLEKKLNIFFKKEEFDAQCYRLSSMIRIIFTKNLVDNRVQRDFLENKNKKKIDNFRKYLFDNNIYYPTSGIMFVATTTKLKDLNYLIKTIKKGFIKFF